MNPRTAGILTIVALALGAFVYFYEIGGEDARRDAEDAAKRIFPGIEAVDVTAIALRTSDGVSARITREPGDEAGWQLVSPVSFPADAFAVDAMASSLASLTSETVIESPQPLAEYGLDEASAKVIRFEAGGEERSLRIGRNTPIGANAYVATGDGTVYTVVLYTANGLEKSLDDLRERRIVSFERSEVTGIEARWPEGRVVLERESAAPPGPDDAGAPGEAGWRITEPIVSRADDVLVGDLLDDLSYLRATGFVDDPAPDAVASFEPPAFELELFFAETDGVTPEPVRFAVGGATGEAMRLVRATQLSLYTIAEERFDDFPRNVDAYRHKQVTSFDLAAAASIEFFFQPAVGDPLAVTATRGETGWSSSPVSIDPGKLGRMASELSRLRAEGIAGDDLDASALEALQLSPPNTIVTVFGRIPELEGDAPEPAPEDAPGPSAPVLAEVHIGRVEGSERIAARTPGDPIVYELSYSLAEHLPVSLAALHNRFVAEEVPEPLDTPPEVEDLLSPLEESP